MLYSLVIGLAVVVGLSIIMVEFRAMLRVTLFGSRNQSSSFEPARDIPSLEGKVVLITGAAGDLGRQTTVELARYGRPARIYIADLPLDEGARKKLVHRIAHEVNGLGSEKKDGMATEIRFLDLDLTSFESVRKCAAEFVAKEERLDILVLNAGIIHVATGLTREGFEIHLGLNYLGHALLSRLLLPTMLRTAQQHPNADLRVVVVSSEGHAMAPKGGIQFDKLRTDCADMSYTQRYGQSKLALIGLTRELAREYPQLKSVAIHPGRILTGMAVSLRKESLLARITAPIAPLVCVSVADGVKNHLWAATSPDAESGRYYEPVGVAGKETAVARNEDLFRRLREWTDNELEGVSLTE
ncbi:NAD(P)-binding protein [Hypoxylon sp. FL1150]|nr:NAD(P)-binding protein [Hypoxylon sp. FL1150]